MCVWVVCWRCARQAISTSVGLEEDAVELVAGLVSSVDVDVWCLVLELAGACRLVGGAEGVRFIRAKVGSRNLYLDRVGAKNRSGYFCRWETNGPDQDFVCKRY